MAKKTNDSDNKILELIKEINRQKVQNVRDYKQTIQKMKKGETLLLLVKRGANTFYLALKAAKE